MANEVSAIYGTPDEIAQRLEALRESGVGYVLINGGGSGGGARGRESLRRFARGYAAVRRGSTETACSLNGARVPASPPFSFNFQESPAQSW